eukprot:2242856-Rhodomonas_salina.2
MRGAARSHACVGPSARTHSVYVSDCLTGLARRHPRSQIPGVHKPHSRHSSLSSMLSHSAGQSPIMEKSILDGSSCMNLRCTSAATPSRNLPCPPSTAPWSTGANLVPSSSTMCTAPAESAIGTNAQWRLVTSTWPRSAGVLSCVSIRNAAKGPSNPPTMPFTLVSACTAAMVPHALPKDATCSTWYADAATSLRPPCAATLARSARSSAARAA